MSARNFSRFTGATASAALLTLIAAMAPTAVRADDSGTGDVTYTRDVAPIMIDHCVQCHHADAAAPMTLTSYSDTRPWAKMIRKVVSERVMPPWGADRIHGKFSNDTSLTDAEIDTIVRWVDAGAPEGEPSLMPEMPEFTDGWQLGPPDYIIELDEVEIPAEGPDLFPNLMVKIDIPEKRWVRALEIRPDDLGVNHHVVLFMSDVGVTGRGGTFDALAVWAAGTPPVVYPEGMGRWLKSGARLTANMHYHPNGTATTDRTRVGIYWGEGEMEKEISTALAGSFNFAIPPHTPHYAQSSSYFIDQDVRVVSFFPHMHMRGKTMRFTAKYPDGREEILLNVPKYDFNWQLFYYPENDVILPEDTEVVIDAVWDNSADNPNNPDPSKTLTFGEQSDEEMMFGLFEFVPVEGSALKPISTKKQIDRILSRLPEGEGFSIRAGSGMMGIQSAMHLPREGEGQWMVAFGGSVMPIPLVDLKWDGNTFSFKMEIMGGRFGTMSATGTVLDDGSVEGNFETSGMSFGDMQQERDQEHVRRARASADDDDDADTADDSGDRRGRMRRGGGGGRGAMMGMFPTNFKGELYQDKRVSLAK